MEKIFCAIEQPIYLVYNKTDPSGSGKEKEIVFFEIGPYKLDVDVEKTRYFYEHHGVSVSQSCSCENCLNFEEAVDLLPPSVKSFFDGLGVDLKKVCECNTGVPEDGYAIYDGYCHICGTLLEGETVWKRVRTSTGLILSKLNEEYMVSIAPDFRIFFQEDGYYVKEEFPLPVIQLQFKAKIPWLLDE